MRPLQFAIGAHDQRTTKKGDHMMRLVRIKPVNWGPFAPAQVLEVAHGVTAITGANDVGKSTLLRLMKLLGRRDGLREADLARDYRRSGAGSSWKDLRAVGADVTFAVESATNHLEIGDELTYEMRMDPSERLVPQREVHAKRGGAESPHSHMMPECSTFMYSGNEALSEVIPLKGQLPADRALLRIAFGAEEPLPSLQALSEAERAIRLDEGADLLTQTLSKVFAGPVVLRVRLHPVGTDGVTLSISDSLKASSSVQARGAGVRRLLTLAVQIAATQEFTKPALILIDEPENSLHADAQHTFRSFLEAISEGPGLQVVYATHSSGMVNVFRPDTVAVLTRNKITGATTTIARADAKFGSVRSALGVNLADSLLLGPVSLVTEGETEMTCLRALLFRLHEQNVPGFERVPRVMSLCPLVNGAGDSYERVSRVIRDLGSRPVIFLDGDKARRVEGLTDPTPRVLLPAGREFEDLVPIERYIEALAAIHDDTRVTHNAYVEWLGTAKLPEKMPTSKRIDRWLGSLSLPYDKPATMEKAIDITDPPEIATESLAVLVATVASELRAAGNSV